MKMHWKNSLIVLIAFAVLVSCCACKRTYVPSKRAILKDPEKYCLLEKPEMYYDQVCENWGEPVSVEIIDKENKISLAAWECRERHILIYFDKNGKALEMHVTMFCTCTLLYESSEVGDTSEGPYFVAQSNDEFGNMKNWLVMIPEKCIPDHILKQCKNGTVLKVECVAIVMQFEPCEISVPYSIKLVG